ncbi:dihydrofolate reductase family protein [Nocardiopsis sp. NPDC006139]|uniref:dihydrofolate reductase family protein n=1 Tax=unclassified Nocardiopsis TaxID=2649073 RepID=UPI00159AFC23|nr:dihydrofolate reductase [Nocardiopsis flavescens]
MRDVVLYQLLSLDGVAEEPGDWFSDPGREVFDNLGRVIAGQDTVLLGRGTYDYWADYWPTSDVEPFSTFVNRTEKVVFGSADPDQRWERSTFVSSPAAEYVARLKRDEGGDIGVHGSIRLARSLWREGLVDVLELVVAPAVAGRGRRLFEEGFPAERLELTALSRSAAGTLFLTYRRV